MTILMACIMYGDPPFNLLVCKSLVYIDLTQAILNIQIIIYGEDKMCNLLDIHGTIMQQSDITYRDCVT